MKYKLLRILAIPISLFKMNYTLIIKTGHLKSYIQLQAIDNDNNPIPWYTYSAINYLKNLDFCNQTVFEFGSGNSSLWWAKRVKNIVSVEDDKNWYTSINRKILKNQQLIYSKTKQEYINALKNNTERFDIIIIDGNHRLACCEAAIIKLSENGFIVLDNSDVEQESVRFLKNNNFQRVNFVGFGPINSYSWETSIFF